MHLGFINCSIVMVYTLPRLVYICAMISLSQIITDECTHILPNTSFINTICHSDVFRPVKGLPQGVQLIHSNSKVNQMIYQM